MVTGFGSLVADVLMISEAIKSNHKNIVDLQTIQVGGVIPTALITLSRLGTKAEFCTTVGDDEFANTLLSILKKEKVDTHNILRLASTTTPLSIVILNKKNGKRTNYYTTGVFPKIKINQFKIRIKKNTKLLLIDGHNIEVAYNLVDQGKNIGAKVLLDLGSPKKGIDKLIMKTDIVIIPKAYWRYVWPKFSTEEIIREVHKIGPKIIVVTMEEKGCVVSQRNNIYYQPGFKVNAVDTNGAGDVFLGTFAFGLLQNWDLPKIAKFASGAAALSCTKIGKDNKIPSFNEIINFLKSNNQIES